MINLLIFHKICDQRTEQFEDVSLYILKDILADCHYEFPTIDELQNSTVAGKQVGLTFDDGNSSDFNLVFPVLREHSARATFFVVTRWLDKPGFLTTKQVRELHRAGMQIGSHSSSHPDFRKLSTAERGRELDESRKTLEDITGAVISTFAFPYGSESKDAIDAVMAAGYSHCCTSRHGVMRGMASVMPRNSIHSRTTPAAVRQVLAAGWNTRLVWKLEDAAKAAVKSSFPHGYPAIRARFVRK